LDLDCNLKIIVVNLPSLTCNIDFDLNRIVFAALEMVSQKRRVVFSCISDILANLGTAFFGLIAWKVPYWRYMMRAIYAPLLVVVFYIFLVDEGVRWLLAHNKKDEAVRVLNKVAKINKITLSEKAKEMLTSITEEARKAEQVTHLDLHHVDLKTLYSRLANNIIS
jgi:hypothetical protein